MTLLNVRNVSITIEQKNAPLKEVISPLSFSIANGEIVGIVGESGSGKTLLAKAIMQLLTPPCYMQGSITLKDKELTTLTSKELCSLRGNRISMVFQDPMTALNPTMKIGKQIAEVLHIHHKIPHHQSKEQILHLLSEVKLDRPSDVFYQYPHTLSGGMRQRVLIAMAIACQPDLLIADEPTTALDSERRGEILHLFQHIREALGTSLLLITHDLHLAKELCDRIFVIYCGTLCELGSQIDIFSKPLHPYTQGLLGSLIQHNLSRIPAIPGPPVDARIRPSGCPFHPRCPYAMPHCQNSIPPLLENTPQHHVACWLHQSP